MPHVSTRKQATVEPVWGVGCLQQTGTERFGSVVQFGCRQDPFPFVSTRKDDKPALVIASLEALAMLLGLKAFYGETPPEERSTFQVLPTWTDNKRNGSILTKLMCTRYPVSAILMELAVHMKAMEQKTAVNWTPREANREADASANGDSSGFDPAKEIKFDLSHMHWRILPDALQMGEDAVHDAERRGALPHTGKKRRRRRLEEGLKMTDPW